MRGKVSVKVYDTIRAMVGLYKNHYKKKKFVQVSCLDMWILT